MLAATAALLLLACGGSSHPGPGGGGDIWIYDLARGTLARLTVEGSNSSPAWTPDGRRVAFHSLRGTKHGIYLSPADSSGKPELLLESDTLVTPTSWTRDVKTLFYTQGDVGGNQQICTLPGPGSDGQRKPRVFLQTSFQESDAQISPDGRWVAHVSTESGMQEIYVRPYPGPGEKVPLSTGGGFQPRWSPNGRELFYVAGQIGHNDNSLMAVDVQTASAFRAGQPRAFFRFQAFPTYDVAPDGKCFLRGVVESGGQAAVPKLEAVVDWFEDLRRRAPLKK